MRRFRLAQLSLVGLLMLAPGLAMPRAVPQAAGNEIVYIAKKGKKYHRKNCPTLKHSKVRLAIKLKDAVKAGYTPCKICHPPTLPKEGR